MLNSKTSFSDFLLLFEGGAATSKWNTERANKKDIETAITYVAKATGIDAVILRANLLGSTRLVASGKKQDSGDIDIAIDINKFDQEKINKKMLDFTGGEGKINKGMKIGSFAVPTGSKKVQVDLMFVKDIQWAKFAYHSSEGHGSKYKGAVRNVILMTAVSKIQKPGEDFVFKNSDGEVIARASRSMRLDGGLERLFKVAPMRKDGKGRTKSLQKVDPEVLKKELETIEPALKDKFVADADVKLSPDAIAEFLFGNKVKAKDLMTAENVIMLLGRLDKKLKADIIGTAKEALKKSNLQIPKELK